MVRVAGRPREARRAVRTSGWELPECRARAPRSPPGRMGTLPRAGGGALLPHGVADDIGNGTAVSDKQVSGAQRTRCQTAEEQVTEAPGGCTRAAAAADQEPDDDDRGRTAATRVEGVPASRGATPRRRGCAPGRPAAGGPGPPGLAGRDHEAMEPGSETVCSGWGFTSVRGYRLESGTVPGQYGTERAGSLLRVGVQLSVRRAAKRGSSRSAS